MKTSLFEDVFNLIAWICITLILLALSIDVSAGDWTKADTTRQMIYTALLTADALTTLDIRNHDDIQEAGVSARQVLGHNPEPLPTVAYFTAIGALNYVVARNLPPGRWRTGFQTFSALTAGTYLVNNWRIGLSPTLR